MDDEELLGFLEKIKHKLEQSYKTPGAEIKGDVISLNGKALTKWRDDGWRLFKNLERLRMIGILEIEDVTFSVNRERLQEEIDHRRRQLEIKKADTKKVIAELYIKGNNLMIKIMDRDLRVQRLNFGTNVDVLLRYGLKNSARMITRDEVQATREQKNDYVLRDIAETLSKDKAPALKPILDVFFDDLSKHTITVRNMASVGNYKAKQIVAFYTQKQNPENTPKTK